MTDGQSDAMIDPRLRDFFAAQLRQAEADYPHLVLREPGPRRAAPSLGLALVAAIGVAAVVLLRPWWALPQVAGGHPLGSDGVPLSIDGQPVLRGIDIDNRLAAGTSFLAGGYLVLHLAACELPAPLTGAGCTEDWRLEDASGAHSIGVTTVGGGATFTRTSRAPTVFRVRPTVDGGAQPSLIVESVAWRQPTKGPIPEEATPPEGGEVNIALVPDFVSAWGGPTGETIVGYVPKDLLLNPAPVVGGTVSNPPQPIPLPVYGEDLTTLVGHMVPGRGFVPLGSSPAPSGALGSPSAGPSAETWGPLAVIPRQGGAAQARTEGTLRITDTCVFLESTGAVALLVWPADRTSWTEGSRAITFTNVDRSVITVSDGDHLILGGGGDSTAESGLTGEAWVGRMEWVARPAPSCAIDERWTVGAVNR